MLEKAGISEISITPENNRIRYYHYEHTDGSAVYMFVNEGSGIYEGTVELPESRGCYMYDAWENTIQDAEAVWDEADGITRVSLALEPLKSCLLVFEQREKAEVAFKKRRRHRLPERVLKIQFFRNLAAKYFAEVLSIHTSKRKKK